MHGIAKFALQNGFTMHRYLCDGSILATSCSFPGPCFPDLGADAWCHLTLQSASLPDGYRFHDNPVARVESRYRPTVPIVDCTALVQLDSSQG